jgi:aminoglycoside phosphotransferase (APT) family kinase protein
MGFEEAQILARKHGSSEYLGKGQESWVFALDESRIIRISNPKFCIDIELAEYARRRQVLYSSLSKYKLGFATPEIYQIGQEDSFTFSIEKRIHGTRFDVAYADNPLLRSIMQQSYFASVEALSKVAIVKSEQQFGVVLTTEKTVPFAKFSVWTFYLHQTLSMSLAENKELLEKNNIVITEQNIDQIIANIKLHTGDIRPCLVHGDFNPENILVDLKTGMISGVLDFSDLTVTGDARLDLAGALVLPEISHTPGVKCAPIADFSSEIRLLIHQKYGNSIDQLINMYRLYYALVFCGTGHPWVLENLRNINAILDCEQIWVPNELRPHVKSIVAAKLN